jgi:uncharacterized protein with HEPN domain
MAHYSTRVWLVDICGEISGIRELTKHADLATFADNWAMKRVVEHARLIVAEAAKHLPQEMKDSQPDVPWQKIHGLGNLLRHEYRSIDPEVLWSIVTEHLDTLDRAAVALLEKLEE